MSTNPSLDSHVTAPATTSSDGTVRDHPRGGQVHHRVTLRLAAALLLAGQLLYIVITQFHTGGDANDHHEIFIHYAGSSDWKGVHVGQFLAMAIMVAGLLALGAALNARARATTVLGTVVRSASALAGVALALYAALQAVDGVGNQQVDAAWTHASAADKPARFASAEAMRWLEWGMRSYHDYALGLTLILFAVAAAALARGAFPKRVAWLMGATGLTYLAQGWVVGTDGFSATDSILIVVAWALSLGWTGWLLASTRHRLGPDTTVAGAQAAR